MCTVVGVNTVKRSSIIFCEFYYTGSFSIKINGYSKSRYREYGSVRDLPSSALKVRISES